MDSSSSNNFITIAQTISDLLKDEEYKKWLIELKSSIKQQQLKAIVAVNSQLIMLYWDMGRQIVDKQEHAKWGTGFINQLSKDLKEAFPEMSGFSRSNLFAIKNFYLFYAHAFEFVQQPAGQIANTIIQQTA